MTALQVIKILNVTQKEGDVYSNTTRKELLKSIESTLPLSEMSKTDLIEMLDTVWFKRMVLNNNRAIQENNLDSGIRMLITEINKIG